MSRPTCLDLFCGVGGASVGLERAGFEVWGVDIEPQPDYPHPDRFIQADALRPPVDPAAFDFIWASPPCQLFSWATPKASRGNHVNHIPAVRDLLARSGRPSVMENVQNAPLRHDLILSGHMFGLDVIKRRYFEVSGFWVLSPQPALLRTGKPVVTTAGHQFSAPDGMAALGIDWTRNRKSLANAVPPAYAEFIGREAMRQVCAERAA